jgi:hypothetical protein
LKAFGLVNDQMSTFTTVFFTKSGIKMTAMDGSHVLLFYVEIKKEEFAFYPEITTDQEYSINFALITPILSIADLGYELLDLDFNKPQFELNFRHQEWNRENTKIVCEMNLPILIPYSEDCETIRLEPLEQMNFQYSINASGSEVRTFFEMLGKGKKKDEIVEFIYQDNQKLVLENWKATNEKKTEKLGEFTHNLQLVGQGFFTPIQIDFGKCLINYIADCFKTLQITKVNNPNTIINIESEKPMKVTIKMESGNFIIFMSPRVEEECSTDDEDFLENREKKTNTQQLKFGIDQTKVTQLFDKAHMIEDNEKNIDVNTKTLNANKELSKVLLIEGKFDEALKYVQLCRDIEKTIEKDSTEIKELEKAFVIA